MSDKTFYVTTPIYYVNARPHIGHAYTTIVADVLARRHRLLGDDTFFLTGTDEHGQKIERSAAAAGIPPQQFADQVSKSFEDLWKRMGITNNDYIRTTSEKHKRGVQKLFSTLYERGFIYLASYTGSYCVSDEAFVDAPVGTPCPDCGRLLEEVTEENFFFKLSEFQAPIIELIESGKLSITPESRRNEVLSFVRGNVAAVVTEVYDRAVAEKIEKPDPLEISVKKGEPKNKAASELLRSRSTQGPQHLALELYLGHPCARAHGEPGCAETRDLRVARRVGELHDRAWVWQRRRKPVSRNSGRRIYISLGKKSFASTASTGPRFCWRPGCHCPRL